MSILNEYYLPQIIESNFKTDAQGGNSVITMRLNNDDTLFREIRDLNHITHLGPLLHKKTVAMQEMYVDKLLNFGY